MDFFDKTGPMAIGSRLRILTDTITRDAASIYKMYGIDFKPKWFPVFYALTEGQPKSVTLIAKEIGQTHPSVSTIVKEMLAKGIVKEVEDRNDRRRSLVGLSGKGKKMTQELLVVVRDVDRAVKQLLEESTHDLWAAITEWENLLAGKSVLERVKEVKSKREQN